MAAGSMLSAARAISLAYSEKYDPAPVYWPVGNLTGTLTTGAWKSEGYAVLTNSLAGSLMR
jgi:hypothetical protein